MKKLVSLFIASTMIFSLTIISLADTGNFDFHVTPPKEVFSSEVKKADYEQTFYVTTTSINLKNDDAFWYGPRYGSTVMSSGLRITNKSDSRQNHAYNNDAYPSRFYRLRGNSRLEDIKSGSVYQINASGRWTP